MDICYILRNWLASLTVAVFLYGIVFANDDYIIVTDLENSSIWMGPIATWELTKIPIVNLYRPVAVDFDCSDRKVYWTDVVRNTIGRANMDGSEEEILVSFLSVPDGLTIDSANQVMYWTDAGTDLIEKANLDGSGRTTIIDDGLDLPRAIVVDASAGYLYWTDWGNYSKIERSRVDGTERVVLIETDLQWPNGIALDFIDQRIYWCDAGMNRIETTDRNGGNRIILFEYHDINIHPFDLGISGNDLIWSDWAFYTLAYIDKYAGRQASLVGPPVFQRAGGVHIVSLSPTTTDTPSTKPLSTTSRLITTHMEPTSTEEEPTTADQQTTATAAPKQPTTNSQLITTEMEATTTTTEQQTTPLPPKIPTTTQEVEPTMRTTSSPLLSTSLNPSPRLSTTLDTVQTTASVSQTATSKSTNHTGVPVNPVPIVIGLILGILFFCVIAVVIAVIIWKLRKPSQSTASHNFTNDNNEYDEIGGVRNEVYDSGYETRITSTKVPLYAIRIAENNQVGQKSVSED